MTITITITTMKLRTTKTRMKITTTKACLDLLVKLIAQRKKRKEAVAQELLSLRVSTSFFSYIDPVFLLTTRINMAPAAFLLTRTFHSTIRRRTS